MKKFALALIIISLLSACKKDGACDKCDNLEQSLVDNNVSNVGAAVNAVIASLKDKTYTESNVSLLVQKITSQCDVNAKVFCFDCIKTLPSQTEIELSGNSSGTSYSRTVDISYSASNQMVFRNMHE